MQELKIPWLIFGITILVSMLGIGIAVTKKPFGILIDTRNKISLSQFQLFLWTWLFTSAFLAVAFTKRTMNIELDPSLWALMGISVGSGVGSLMVKGYKKGLDPSEKIKQEITPHREGVIHVEQNKEKASFWNMFQSEEVLEYKIVDFTKVQMFFFTIMAVLGYFQVLWGIDFEQIKDMTKPLKFPALSTSLTTMVGISHAGYLIAKAAPRTPTESDKEKTQSSADNEKGKD